VTSEQDLTTAKSVAALIDHTLLKPDATRQEIVRICEEAGEFHFASVCVNPCWVSLVSDAVQGTDVRVCTVIGFPLGADDRSTKLFEASLALSQGANELDVVQNIGALRSHDYQIVETEITELTRLVHAQGALVKVILETCLLSDHEKVTACRVAQQAHADFVKTSTGFSSGGATIADVQLMRRTVSEKMGVKASGGIRTLAQLREMVQAGANRIGASAGVAIIREVASGTAPQDNVAETAGLNRY
jgi:deoxyribose-phosphate aldolase